VLFKTVFVTGRAQVSAIEGIEKTALEPPCEPVTGDSDAHLIARMQVARFFPVAEPVMAQRPAPRSRPARFRYRRLDRSLGCAPRHVTPAA
jgi:hypothetical protein